VQVFRRPMFVSAELDQQKVFFVSSATNFDVTSLTLTRDDLNNLATFEEDDLLLLFFETTDADITITSPAGWTAAPNSPVINVGNNLRLYVFWKRMTTLSEADLTWTYSDHCVVWLQWFRGVLRTGDPFADTEVSTGNGTSTVTFGDVTTDEDNQFIVMAAALGQDANNSKLDDYVNTNLFNFWNWHTTYNSFAGNRGALGTAFGYKANPGAIGATTALQTTDDLTTPQRQAITGPYATWTAALKGETNVITHFCPSLDFTGGSDDSFTLYNRLQSGDIILWVFETSDGPVTHGDTDWQDAPDTPVINTNTRLTLFWKRWAETEEIEPLVPDPGEHFLGIVFNIRGCVETGSPFDFTDNDTGGTGAAVTTPGGTTTLNNAFVIGLVGTTYDFSSSAVFSSFANGDLTGVTEFLDNTISTQSGGGFGGAYGIKTTAGLLGGFSATQASAVEWCGWVGALKPQNISVAPTYQGAGTSSYEQATSARQIQLPSDVQANDILIMVLETAADKDITITNPPGWEAAPDSPVTNAGANPTRLFVFWKRATGKRLFPVITSSHNHTVRREFIMKNCLESGSPFDDTQSSTGTGSTGMTMTGITTTVDGCFVLIISAHADYTNRPVQGYVNADLPFINLHTVNLTPTGNKGALSVGGGYKDTAGSVGNTTATQDLTTDWAAWVGALKPKT